MTVVNMHQAKSQLSKLVQRAEEGEEILIARNGKPVAKLVKVERRTTPRPLGVMRGRLSVPEDFDKDNEEIIRLFYEGDSPTDPLRSAK